MRLRSIECAGRRKGDELVRPPYSSCDRADRRHPARISDGAGRPNGAGKSPLMKAWVGFERVGLLREHSAGAARGLNERLAVGERNAKELLAMVDADRVAGALVSAG